MLLLSIRETHIPTAPYVAFERGVRSFVGKAMNLERAFPSRGPIAAKLEGGANARVIYICPPLVFKLPRMQRMVGMLYLC